jgi:hypothetical protein
MTTWAEFAKQEPELAAFGRERFHGRVYILFVLSVEAVFVNRYVDDRPSVQRWRAVE